MLDAAIRARAALIAVATTEEFIIYKGLATAIGVAAVPAENRADIGVTAAEGAIGRDAGSKEAPR